MINRAVALLVFLLFALKISAQVKGVVNDLEKLIKEDKFTEADKIIRDRIPQLFGLNNPDTLVSYPKYIGKIAAKLRGDDAAIREIQAFAEKVRATAGIPPRVLLRVYLESAGFFSLKGKNDLAYKTVKQVGRYTIALQKEAPIEAALVQSEMGVYGYRMGNIGLSSFHHRKATAILETLAVPNYERSYNTYNSMGTIMWFSSKIDSGIYYFDKAIAALNKLSPTPENKNYRVGIVQNNIAQLYNEQGNTAKAIHTMEDGIMNMKTFLASKDPNPKKDVATIRQYEFIDNLARIYRHLGDFSKAESLLFYSYQQKLKAFSPQSPDIYKSLISLGSLYFEQMDYKKALEFLQDGLKRVESEASPSPLWAGEACNALARVYTGLGDKKLAGQYFRLTDSLYEASYQGEYDETYLDFLRESAMFYAGDDQPAFAVAKAKKGYDYIVKTQGGQTLSAFMQLLNLARVYYELGDYDVSLRFSQQGLAVLNKRIGESKERLDSIKIEMNKPTAILLKAKAEYELLPVKDTAGIAGLLRELNEAVGIIQRKRTIIKDPGDITLLMAQHKDLLDFIKQLKIKLFEMTGDQSLIDQVIDLHESAIYNRIRSRLDKQSTLRFAEVPATVQVREEQLFAAINASLQSSRSNNESMQAYLNAVNKWKEFQLMLQEKYPRYYAMRYASAKDKKIREIEQNIPAGITVLRYLYVGKELFVLVADKNKHNWVPLRRAQTDEWIVQLADPTLSASKAGELSAHLYQQLWKPLEKYIANNRVIVIPDGPLYYLSFEMLTPRQTTSFKEFAKECLLSKYAISYHYSLLALRPEQEQSKQRSNFTAFVPEFSDQVKKDYRTALKTDTLELDNEYLSLLPLPFSVDLAKKTQQQMGGDIFIGDQSTPAAFKAKAGNNAIIYIGTHAEANNLYPEYSRLIFAKDLQHVSDSNSIFLFDIYNYDLMSDLTVLTACETGRPGFYDGEGMISMAHAFSYAGSESILTGLWKIDEQATSVITGYFYKNLQQDMTKDIALQRAKLSYLETANGRMLAPFYWAGLVIMGDTSSVELQKSNTSFWWIAGGIALLLLLTVFVFKRRKS